MSGPDLEYQKGPAGSAAPFTIPVVVASISHSQRSFHREDDIGPIGKSGIRLQYFA